ncbi:MAG: MBOAT family protein [Bacteroidales bacterium]|nr:MBOAT family protein [Bacteroidales bacterium]
MVFNSLEFLIFFIIFFLLWPIVRKRNTSRWLFITTASAIFYAWWDWRFLFLILFSGLIDYISGILLIKNQKGKKIILGFSLLANLGSLSIFKYSVFFSTIIQDVLKIINIEIDLIDRIPDFALILPVGISFYTFQSLSYTIDIYRGRLQPTKNILHFFSYLAMFPQLVAGPIIRASDFLHQLKTYRIVSDIEKWNAIKLICFGLFQKVVIADNLSFFIDSSFENKSVYDGTLYWWIVSIAFSFQIYNDFSGYSLIARGIAKLMGFHFKMNFNHPYLANSLRQFWTRWHISLSTWFRDYIYIPMGGSYKGVYRAFFALVVTMLLSGLWHGANYTFIVWASLHIVFLYFERLTNWPNKLKKFTPFIIVIIFIQVTIAWVYFRAENLEQANMIIGKLFIFKKSNLNFFNTYYNNIFFLYLGILIEVSIYLRKRYLPILNFYMHYNLDVISVSVSIIMILFFRGEGQQFIYFQF